MNADETTRIEFAERFGWKLDDSSAHKHCGIKWIPPSGSYLHPWWPTKDKALAYAISRMDFPDPTDANDVHAVLMGMSPLERSLFVKAFCRTVQLEDHHEIPQAVSRAIFVDLSIKVECFLEATKGRVKQSLAPSPSAQS